MTVINIDVIGFLKISTLTIDDFPAQVLRQALNKGGAMVTVSKGCLRKFWIFNPLE